MGFFSWKTSDTKKSIPNYFSTRPTFEVTLKDNEGNEWHESDYQGYGVFGGMDIFDLIAIMNGWTRDNVDTFHKKYKGGDRKDWKPTRFIPTELRDIGICIWNDKDTILPILVEDAGIDWSPNLPLEDCEWQGYFYPEDDETHFTL